MNKGVILLANDAWNIWANCTVAYRFDYVYSMMHLYAHAYKLIDLLSCRNFSIADLICNIGLIKRFKFPDGNAS